MHRSALLIVVPWMGDGGYERYAQTLLANVIKGKAIIALVRHHCHANAYIMYFILYFGYLI